VVGAHDGRRCLLRPARARSGWAARRTCRREWTRGDSRCRGDGDNRTDITLYDGGTSSLWWATKNEWLGLIDVSGLEVEALYGGFAGEPLTDESREYVFVTRR
jgi:hypothetical protein